ncbi:MAG: hypothetical protein JWO36_6517 [Myxococcales bacterium]|nr:hypothetical protein [Myxococcales bacterium]
MNTNTPRAAAASVIGARHLRTARNGQDAAAAWIGEDAAAVVVCDGCGSGHSSEVGARIGAQLMIQAISTAIAAGARGPVLWERARAHVTHALEALLENLPGDRALAIRDYFLFTIVAAVMSRDEAAVWMLGDGAYAIDGRTREIGPFDDNQPPYLGYDLLGTAQPAHLEVATASSIVIATDGASDLDGLERFAAARFVDHPDALRRDLAVLARPGERIDWEDRRVIRTPATLQDDCAIGVLLREAP